MEGVHREPAVGQVPVFRRWQDVQDPELGQRLGVIQRQAVGNARAAIMADHGEASVPQRLHQRQHLLAHDALGIVAGIGGRRRRVAVAVALEVWANHGEVARQLGRDLVPGHVGLRKAVQQQEGRAAAAEPDIEVEAANRDPPLFETGKKAHRICSCCQPPRNPTMLPRKNPGHFVQYGLLLRRVLS